MNRRGFITGLIGVLAAPAIVRVDSIMPVKAMSVLDANTVTFRSLTYADIVRAVAEMKRRSVPPFVDRYGGKFYLFVSEAGVEQRGYSATLRRPHLIREYPALLSSPFSG